jgi:uncharacterized coiled-coil protein SlyX
MTEMDIARRVKAHRVLTLTMILVALTGWGAFAYASHSADVAWEKLEEATARSEAARGQLLKEHASALAMLQGQIGDLEQQLRLATARFEEVTPDVSETGGVAVVRPPLSPPPKAHRIKPKP